MATVWCGYEREQATTEAREKMVHWLRECKDGSVFQVDDKLKYADLRGVFASILPERAAAFKLIVVEGSHATDVEMEMIAQIVESSARLEVLVLRDNHFSAKGFDRLKRALAVNRSLKKVVLTPDHEQNIEAVYNVFWYAARNSPPRAVAPMWVAHEQEFHRDGVVVVRPSLYLRMRAELEGRAPRHFAAICQ